MQISIGPNKIEISQDRLNFCLLYDAHHGEMKRYREEIPEMIVDDVKDKAKEVANVSLLRKDVDRYFAVLATPILTVFQAYARIYKENLNAYLQAHGCTPSGLASAWRVYSIKESDCIQDLVVLFRDDFIRKLYERHEQLNQKIATAENGFRDDYEEQKMTKEAVVSTLQDILSDLDAYFAKPNVRRSIDASVDAFAERLLRASCVVGSLANKEFACTPIFPPEMEQAKSLRSQIVSGALSGDTLTDACMKLLQIMPHIACVYPPLFERFGDQSGDLMRLAALMHVEGFDLLHDAAIAKSFKHCRIRNDDELGDYKRQLDEKWAFYGCEGDSSDNPYYMLQKRSLETVKTTFHRRHFDSPETALKCREVYAQYVQADFSTSQRVARESRERLLTMAVERGIPTDWLESLITARLSDLDVRLYSSLEKYFRELELSEEEQAVQARELVRGKAFELGYESFDKFLPLEKLIERFDLRERTVSGREFKTRQEAAVQRRILTIVQQSHFESDVESCRKALEEGEALAREQGIDAEWVLGDLRTALVRHDEESRVVLGYLFDTHAEAESAKTDKELVFRSVWSHVKRFAQSNDWIKLRPQVSERAIENLAQVNKIDRNDLFAYYDTGTLSSGRIGLWVTRSGVSVCSGSVVAEKVGGLFSKILPTKWKDGLSARAPHVITLSWQTLLSKEPYDVVVVDAGLSFPDGTVFECGSQQRDPLKKLFEALCGLGREIQCEVGDGPAAVPDPDQTHGENQFTPWPKQREDVRLAVAVREDDFADRPTKVEAKPEPEDYTSSLEMLVQETKLKASSNQVLVGDEIPAEDTAVFTSSPIEGNAIAREDIICLAKDTGLLKRNKYVAVTDTYVLMAVGDERHAYHFGEIGLPEYKQDKGLSLFLHRYEIQDSYGSGGAIMLAERAEVACKGSEYLSRLLAKHFFGGKAEI